MKCGTSSGTVVANQSACEAAATSVGHGFYSYRMDTRACATSADCDPVIVGDDWQIFHKPTGFEFVTNGSCAQTGTGTEIDTVDSNTLEDCYSKCANCQPCSS